MGASVQAPAPPPFPGVESLLPEVLPKLRDDITIEYGGVDYGGSTTYVIFDQLNNRFFHVDWQSHEILKHWGEISPAELISRLEKYSLIDVDEQQISSMVTFLSEQCLIEQGYPRLQQIFKAQEEKKKMNTFLWLAKNYLFFRVPLAWPDHFITTTYPYVAFIFRKTFFFFMLALAILGVIVISKQWSSFTATFFDMFSISYLIVFGIALIIAKVFHELGHAYSCKRYGLRVPTMGVAFLVMFPMLYTDTGESWRIKSAKERIRISIAGVQMEIYVAIFALWVWILAPPGVIKSIAFFLCTYSLIATIVLNISPFLRFDGYHVLSDLLSMRNLQTRGFALNKWWLREKIFGFKFAPPEKFSKLKMRLLALYAWLTWIYRFFLFIGIAILVYYLFFKVLGIILFVIEIIYFILIPIIRELKVWWQLRSHVKLNRNLAVSILILLFVIGLLAIPWRSEIAMPATFSYKEQRLYSPEPAYIENVLVKRGELVKKDQPLIILNSPKLDFHIEKTKYRIDQINWQLKRIAGDQEELELQKVFLSQLNHQKTQLQAYNERRQRLVIKAPFNGQVVGILDNVALKRWVKNKQLLAEVIDTKDYVIDAYVSENYKYQLSDGLVGRFVPDNIDMPALDVRLNRIAYQQIKSLRLTDPNSAKENNQINQSVYLSGLHASTLGGEIAVRASQKNEFIPEISHYNVQFDLVSPQSENYHLDQIQRGQVFIGVDRESFLSYMSKRIAAFFIRESSF
ncbi:HlyD family efflux transporter periplasmic adaptor subunit [Thiotrichales bacterium 19S3-7]|nr:HlyD family efflux transporter periplasmic adaptor subunit [Thiotrichales bacterium 19S3-7]MCF6802434.1 HlyD family efflux transporter periplasmic adaptor subunit [Thiotrichales bacterium 19S3-11]